MGVFVDVFLVIGVVYGRDGVKVDRKGIKMDYFDDE